MASFNFSALVEAAKALLARAITPVQQCLSLHSLFLLGRKISREGKYHLVQHIYKQLHQREIRSLIKDVKPLQCKDQRSGNLVWIQQSKLVTTVPGTQSIGAQVSATAKDAPGSAVWEKSAHATCNCWSYSNGMLYVSLHATAFCTNTSTQSLGLQAKGKLTASDANPV